MLIWNPKDCIKKWLISGVYLSTKTNITFSLMNGWWYGDIQSIGFAAISRENRPLAALYPPPSIYKKVLYNIISVLF